jgi:hypothetical protein
MIAMSDRRDTLSDYLVVPLLALGFFLSSIVQAYLWALDFGRWIFGSRNHLVLIAEAPLSAQMDADTILRVIAARSFVISPGFGVIWAIGVIGIFCLLRRLHQSKRGETR